MNRCAAVPRITPPHTRFPGELEVAIVVLEGNAAEAIVAKARDLDADLFAMTTHGRGGLDRVILGSVAGAVRSTAPCPILLDRVVTTSPPAVAVD